MHDSEPISGLEALLRLAQSRAPCVCASYVDSLLGCTQNPAPSVAVRRPITACKEFSVWSTQAVTGEPTDDRVAIA